MQSLPIWNSAQFEEGLFLIMQGLFKKIVLGDNLALIVSEGFQHINRLSLLDAWIALACFSLQIFFDFSGYTDIGRGSALLFGFKVPENFNLPYLASNLSEFWRRWHISLSSWLRDYLFIPLGGSRGNEWSVRRNLFITMALGGLWHGAAWHYMVWGAMHGVGLVVTRLWQGWVSKSDLFSRWRKTSLWRWSGVVITVLFVMATWVVFLCDDLGKALEMYQSLLGLSVGLASGDVTALFLTSTLIYTLPAYAFYSFARHRASQLVDSSAGESSMSLPAVLSCWRAYCPFRVIVCAATALVIIGFAPSQVVPFIYFQF